MERVRRAALRSLALAALAVLLTGCLKLTMDLDVTTENTVDGTAIFAIDKEILELTGGSLDDVLGEDALAPPDVEGVSVEPYEDDDFAGQQITFDAVPLDEFNRDSGEGSLTIVREGDTFRVSGLLDMSMDDMDTEGIPFDPEQAFEDAEIRISLSFPGDVESSNGEVDGNTVTWTPRVGERAELNAVASAIGGGGATTIWIALALVAAVAIAAVAIVASRRRSSAPAVGASVAEPTPSAPPSAPDDRAEPPPPPV